jgi:hypothetical protein
MSDPQALADRYVAIWNESDADVRRRTIPELWAEDGLHMVEPPQEVRDAAAALGLASALEARGHDALEARVTRAYEEFVAPGEFRFRPRGDAARLRDVVKFTWEMVPVSGGDAAAVGLELLVLDGGGRIRADYQFIER